MDCIDTAVPHPHHTKSVVAKNSASAGRYVSKLVVGLLSAMVHEGCQRQLKRKRKSEKRSTLHVSTVIIKSEEF
jgi:hypothetical protein